MKLKIFLYTVLIFCTSFIHAQNKLTIPEIKAGPGEQSRITVDLENTGEIAGIQFTLTVPQGLTVKEKEATLTDRKTDHTVYSVRKSSTEFSFVCISATNKPFKGTDGALLEIPVEIPLSYRVGQAFDIRLSGVILGNKSGTDIGSDHKNGILTITEAVTPDLKVSDITMAEHALTPGGAITITWKVENAGRKNSGGGWTEQVTLVSQASGTRYVLGTTSYKGDLDIKQVVSRSARLNIPRIAGMDGDVKVEVNVIPDSSVKEQDSDKGNNKGQSANVAFLENIFYLTLDRTGIQANSSGVVRAVVERSGSRNDSRTLNIITMPEGGFRHPATVVINKNESSAAFLVSVKDSTLFDGSPATIMVKVSNELEIRKDIQVTDVRVLAVRLTASKQVASAGDKITVTLQTDMAWKGDVGFAISSDHPKRWKLPEEVVLRGGSRSVTFEAEVMDTKSPEAGETVKITAKAQGYPAATVSVLLESANIPRFGFVISPDTVSESDGTHATYGTIKRLDHQDVAVELRLTADTPDVLILPATIKLPAYTNDLRFNIGVVDNSIVDGTRKVKVTASVYIPSCSCIGNAGNGGAALEQTVTVFDNDNPALHLKANPSTVKAGLVKAAEVTISRNTTSAEQLAKPVVVKLSSDAPSVVEIPATVNIPVNQQSVTVNINTRIDAGKKGDQTIRIRAEAEGYSGGFSWIMVTDQNKADAVISGIQVPGQVTAGEKVEIKSTILNQGFATLAGGGKIEYYLSVDHTTKGLNPFYTSVLSKTVEANKSFDLVESVPLPEQGGAYNLIVVFNPDQSVDELIYYNNQASVPVELAAGHSATIKAGKAIYMPGETVILSGQTLDKANNPVGNRNIEITLENGDFTRTFNVTSNSSGNYEYRFNPLNGENGHYSVSAGYPKYKTSPQAGFDILGFELLDKGYIKWEVVEGVDKEGELNIRNNTKVNLSGIRIELPADAGFTVNVAPLTLAAGQSGKLKYTITSKEASPEMKYYETNIRIVSGEGAATGTMIYYYCQPQAAKLVVSPVSINTTMVKGGVRYFEFSLTNSGAVAAKDVRIDLPQLDWMKLKSPRTIDQIAPYDSVKVVLELSPTEKQQLNVPLSGNIAVNLANGKWVGVPFKVETVSESTGKLQLDAVDEYTYNTPSAPHLRGAKVVVRHPFSGQVMAEGLTDENGLFETSGISEGYYTVTVTAEKHGNYQNNIMVDPGRTTRKTVFLPYQAISYDWSVKPTEIDDEYQIDLIVDFETNVPKPVVTMEFVNKVPELEPGQCFIADVLFTNHGLIQANDIEIETPYRNGYEFELMVDHIDILAAKSSVTVPLKICRLKGISGGDDGSGGGGGSNPGGGGSSGGDDPGGNDGSGGGTGSGSGSGNNGSGNGSTPCLSTGCVITLLHAQYYYECDKTTGQWVKVITKIWEETLPCPDPCTNSGGSGGGMGGPGGGGWGGSGGPGSWGGPGSISSNVDCRDFDYKCMSDFFNTMYTCITAFVPVDLAIDIIVSCLGPLGGNDPFGIPHIAGCLNTINPKKVAKKIIGSFLCGWGIGSFLNDCTPLQDWIGKALDEINGTSYYSAKSLAIHSRKIDTFQKDYEMYFAAIKSLKELYEIYYDERFLEEDNIVEFEALFSKYRDANGKISSENIQSLVKEFNAATLTEKELISYLQKWNESIDAFTNGGNMEGLIRFDKVNDILVDLQKSTEYAESRGFGTESGAPVEDMGRYVAKVLGLAKEMWYEEQESKTSLCATVTVQFSQKMTMTREAFEGTLTLNNGDDTKQIQEVYLDLIIRDGNGEDMTHLFDIRKDEFLNGTGSVAAGSSGMGTVIFVPTRQAAPTVAKSYSFGGTLSYLDPSTNERVTVQLLPVTLEVNPSPDLVLHYFMQRDILGDDPLTEDVVEPMVPAEMSLLIRNEGYGAARNVKVESMQPRIIDNKLGLMIDFEMTGSNLDNEPKQLGLLNVEFGSIEPHKSRVGQWWFTSTLLGHFVKYDIRVNHLNSNGNKNLSLIRSYHVHELIKSVKAYGNGHDDIADFLVNDMPDPLDTPDMIYYSDGESDEVVRASSAAFSNYISPGKLTTELNVNLSSAGWNYGNVNDPGQNLYRLVKAVRKSDGYELPVENFWQTHVTLRDGADPKYENKLHFVDHITAGTTYVLHYVSTDRNLPKVVSFGNITAREVRTTPVQQVQVSFNKAIDFSSFTKDDLQLVHQGNFVPVDGVQIIRANDSVYFMNMQSLTRTSGFYELTVQCAGIKDLKGNTGNEGKSISWVQVIGELGISRFGTDQNKTQPINTIEVFFNKAVPSGQLTADRLRLNGSPVPDVSVSTEDNLKYTITGLSAYNQDHGIYELTIDLPRMTALDLSTGLVEQSFRWEVDQATPMVVRFTPVYQGAVNNQHITDMLIILNKPLKDPVNPDALTLYRGSADLNIPAWVISQKDSVSWLVSGMADYTRDAGGYKLVVNQSGFVDTYDNYGTGKADTMWIVSYDKPLSPGNMKIIPDRGYSSTDMVTSGDDLRISLSTAADEQQVSLYVVTPVGEVLIGEQFVAKAGVIEVPVNGYTGKTRFKAFARDRFGNQSDPVVIDAYIDVVEIGVAVSAVNEGDCLEMDYIEVNFTEEIIAADFNKDMVAIKAGGISVPGNSFAIEAVSGKEFRIIHLDGVNDNGNITITLDLSSVRKKSSGFSSSGSVQLNLGNIRTFPVIISGSDSTLIGHTIVYTATSGLPAYDWTVSGGEVLGSSDNNITVKWTEKGDHIISLDYVTPSQCNKSAVKKVNVASENVTSADDTEIGTEGSMVIGPVPNDGRFTVFTNGIEGVFTLTIYNAGGAVVYQESKLNISGKYSRYINMGSTASGVYIMVIRNSNRKYETKFVINRL